MIRCQRHRNKCLVQYLLKLFAGVIMFERLRSESGLIRLRLRGAPMGSKAGFVGTLLLLLLITSLGPVLSQTPVIGLSIDCGSVKNYTDSQIQWVTDDGYVRTGKNAQVSANLSELNVNPRQSQTLRYFDEGRGRDCYELPVTPQYTYLIRSTFHYGDWNSPENGTHFHVALNGNNWLELGPYVRGDPTYNADWFDYPYEVMVYIEGNINTLDFCLLRVAGTPFISSLELRQLAPGMYTTVVGNHKYMFLLERLNAGADANGPSYLRYPDDQYDRIWTTPTPDWDNSTHIRKTNISTSTTLERPPKKVMEDAWIYYHSDVLWFTLGDPTSTSPFGPIAVFSYFQEVDGNASASNVRGMEYFVNNYKIDTFNSSDQGYEVRSCIVDVYETFINITVRKAPWSNLKPILNAFEMYYVFSWDGSSTATEEVTIIRSLQKRLGLTDWTGDPCVPIPYDWLNCSSDEILTAAVQTSLELSSDRTHHVTNISLSNRATVRALPQEIASLPNLTTLDLSNTGMASIPYLGLMRLGNLSLLNLSRNRFSGGVREFLQNVTVKSLKQLLAANNSLEGEFPLDQLYSEFPHLEEANFDGNLRIGGILNLTIWHTALVRSMDPASSSVKAAGTPSPAPPPPSFSIFPLVSLKNNNITGITPSLDSLQSDINTYLRDFNTTPGFTNFGILLSGNPWCQQQTFSAQSLSQQYLCRSVPNQVLPGLASLYVSKKSDPWAIIGGVIGGFAALASFGCLAAVWRLRKQTSSLKEIQEALARQKVQPPFYSYTDLRAATNDFSSANKLGQGTFGAVYKGTLLDNGDGRQELVAVKTLYPSKQALTEFLNEAVLITGIKHRNLVQLKGCCIHREDQRMLVYEYAENGNLAEALWGKIDKPSCKNRTEPVRPTLDWQQRLNICVGIARGLSYLHEELQPRIIHRDIKPYNILMGNNFNPKIADFGLARSMLEGQAQADFTSVAGTKGYFSPEYATQGQLTEKADVFSFGVVLLEIVSARKCIDLSLPSEKQFLQAWARYLKENGKLIDLLDPSVRDSANHEEVIRVINLAFLCLDFYPEKRPTMSEAVTMLQGIVDVPLCKPESAASIEEEATFRRSNKSYNYMKLPNFSDQSEANVSDSFVMSATSSNDNNLELSKLSAR